MDGERCRVATRCQEEATTNEIVKEVQVCSPSFTHFALSTHQSEALFVEFVSEQQHDLQYMLTKKEFTK